MGPVTFASPDMEADLNAWLANPTSNWGWIVLGDERISDSSRSSNRGFGSRENDEHPPMLTFEYTSGASVPEPSSIVLLLISLGVMWWFRRGHP
ncbi:MAG: PEP-CTERM sorting domain-containing protein [Planctomycetes bacterium]|nr:PEP-CTERM sorting domain-containing protein [Planctomycetota bacterium]